MVKHTLWESLATSVRPQVGSETEGFVYRQVCLNVEHGGSRHLRFFKYVTTTTIEHSINTTDSILRTLNFHKIDWFHKSRFGGQSRSVQNTSGGRDDLTASTMDSVSMQSNVIDVKSHTTHIFVTKDALFRSPLESSNDRILNFIQVLDSLGRINNNVGAHGVGTETPNLSGFGDIIFVLIGQVATTNLEVLFVANFAGVNVLGKAIRHRYSLHEETVMLVG